MEMNPLNTKMLLCTKTLKRSWSYTHFTKGEVYEILLWYKGWKETYYTMKGEHNSYQRFTTVGGKKNLPNIYNYFDCSKNGIRKLKLKMINDSTKV